MTSAFSKFRTISRTGWVISVLGILVIGAIAWYRMERVVIVITPPSEPLSVEFTVSVAQLGADVSGFVESYPSQYARDFDVSGKKQGEGKSRGVVRLVNTSAAPQVLVATTRLLSKEGMLFRLVRRTQIPAGSEVSAEVYADGSGPAFDIPPTTFTIPGLPVSRQANVFALSDAPMVGGDGQVLAVSQGDMAHARNTLINTAVDIASSRMTDDANRASTNGVLDGQLFDYDISALTLDAVEGDIQSRFSGTANVVVRGVFFPRKDIERRAFDQLQGKVSAEEVLLGMKTKDIVYALDSYDDANKKAVIRVFAQGDKRRVKLGDALSSSVFAGQPIQDVENITRRTVSGAQVQMHGGLPWSDKLPDASRISVVIE